MTTQQKHRILSRLKFGFQPWAVAADFGVSVEQVKAIRQQLWRQRNEAKKRKLRAAEAERLDQWRKELKV